MTLWTEASQYPLSMGFSRQEYWTGLPFPPPEDLPTQELNLCLLHWQVGSLPVNHQEAPVIYNELLLARDSYEFNGLNQFKLIQGSLEYGSISYGVLHESK